MDCDKKFGELEMLAFTGKVDEFNEVINEFISSGNKKYLTSRHSIIDDLVNIDIKYAISNFADSNLESNLCGVDRKYEQIQELIGDLKPKKRDGNLKRYLHAVSFSFF